MESEDLAVSEGVTNADELIAAFQNFRTRKNGNGKVQPQSRNERQPRAATGERSTRKCANCGEAHEFRSCPKPQIAVSDRKCWTCGEKHMAKDCPLKGKGGARPIKAIEDGSISAITASV